MDVNSFETSVARLLYLRAMAYRSAPFWRASAAVDGHQDAPPIIIFPVRIDVAQAAMCPKIPDGGQCDTLDVKAFIGSLGASEVFFLLRAVQSACNRHLENVEYPVPNLPLRFLRQYLFHHPKNISQQLCHMKFHR